MNKPPDEPQFLVAANASRPGLVVFSVGTGTDPYSITPALAEKLASTLIGAAMAARDAGR